MTPDESLDIVRRRMGGESFKSIGRVMGHSPYLVSAAFYKERPDLVGQDLPRTPSARSRISDPELAAVAVRFERGDDIDYIIEALGVSIDDIRIVGSRGSLSANRNRNAKALREIQLQSFIEHNAEITQVAREMYRSGMAKRDIARELGVHQETIFKMIDRKRKD